MYHLQIVCAVESESVRVFMTLSRRAQLSVTSSLSVSIWSASSTFCSTVRVSRRSRKASRKKEMSNCEDNVDRMRVTSAIVATDLNALQCSHNTCTMIINLIHNDIFEFDLLLRQDSNFLSVKNQGEASDNFLREALSHALQKVKTHRRNT